MYFTATQLHNLHYLVSFCTANFTYVALKFFFHFYFFANIVYINQINQSINHV